MMRSMRLAVVSGFLVGVSLSTVMGCGGSPRACSASSCKGCCTADGVCSGGGTLAQCGTGGVLCQACTAGTQCTAGVCASTGMGGGTGTGGGSATGGGTGTGGGSATGGGTGTGGGSATGGGTGTGGGGSATGGGSGTGGGGGSMGACGARALVDHLVISEVRVTPTPGEAVELYNPTSSTVDLSDYWLYNATFTSTDGGLNCRYFDHTTNPSCGTAFGDFDLRFPAGATIGPGQTVVIALTGAANFNSQCDGGCVSTRAPDFEVPPPSGGDPAVPDMRGAWEMNAQVFSSFGFLTNSSEDLVLYRWDGAGGPVSDVDYVIWGSSTSVRTDKTGVPGFAMDTPVASQQPMSGTAGVGTSYQRACYNETTEAVTSGNGVTGHDETSEPLGATFTVGPPSFGAKTPGSVP